jgi:Uma2 family endonuclease
MACGYAIIANMGASTSLLTFAEFEQLPDEPGKLELLDGELIRLPPSKTRNMRIAEILFKLLDRALDRGGGSPQLGRAHMEFGYKIGAAAWLQPDVSIEYKGQTENDYLEGAPALAVEVISESNRADQMDRKVKKYLSGGAIEVWVAYPKTQCVWVFRQGYAKEFCGELRSELFPGLTIDLEALFSLRPD